MRILIVPVAAGLCFALAACNQGTNTAACSADPAASFVGQTATPETVATAQTAAGAGTTRVIRPGDVVTQDFRTDRLNLDVDAANLIVQARCG